MQKENKGKPQGIRWSAATLQILDGYAEEHKTSRADAAEFLIGVGIKEIQRQKAIVENHDRACMEWDHVVDRRKGGDRRSG